MDIIVVGAGSDLGVHIDGAKLGPAQLINDIKGFYHGETLLLDQDPDIIKSRHLGDRRKNEYEIEKYNSNICLRNDVKKTSPLEMNTICFMGTNVVSGSGIGVVVSIGNQTYFGNLAKSISHKKIETNFDKGVKEIENEFIDSNYGNFKTKVADVVIDKITEIQNKYNEIINSDYLDEILDKGAEKNIEISKYYYLEMKKRIGLGK